MAKTPAPAKKATPSTGTILLTFIARPGQMEINGELISVSYVEGQTEEVPADIAAACIAGGWAKAN